jgi:hypothetical protein
MRVGIGVIVDKRDNGSLRLFNTGIALLRGTHLAGGNDFKIE